MQRYIPAGSRAVRLKGLDAVVYVREFAGKHIGCAFAGKSNKPAWHYSYRSAENLAAQVREWGACLKARADLIAQRQAERNAFQHTLKAGDVLSTCWGYDQTNREYFEVTKVIGKFVEVREIAQERKVTALGDRGYCHPLPGQYIGTAERKKVLRGNQLKMSKWGRYASPVEVKEICGAKVYGADAWSAYA